ncbi:unnamed protein product, partial [Adineta ricciae]
SLLNFPRSSASNHRNPNNYKNEFRMEIPVTVVANNDQENFTQNTITSTDGILDYDLPIPTVPVLRIPSASSNQALKSILKRSASRETVLRKNANRKHLSVYACSKTKPADVDAAVRCALRLPTDKKSKNLNLE